MKSLCDWTRKELEALPVRDWQQESEYESILIVPNDKKHDSGWRIMQIIGVRENQPVEIAAYCDDICWKTVGMERFGPNKKYSTADLRSDCAYKSRSIHFWTRKHKFKVGCSLSSTDIEMVPIEGTQTKQVDANCVES